jgi:hypothetical protein
MLAQRIKMPAIEADNIVNRPHPDGRIAILKHGEDAVRSAWNWQHGVVL